MISSRCQAGNRSQEIPGPFISMRDTELTPDLHLLFLLSRQLIEGSSKEQQQNLGVMTPDYYYYLNQSETYKVDGTDDRSDFHETMVSSSVGVQYRAHHCDSYCDYPDERLRHNSAWGMKQTLIPQGQLLQLLRPLYPIF